MLTDSAAVENLLGHFGNWTPWHKRDELQLQLPGVYMLARFENCDSLGKPKSLSNVLYIGETCGQTLYKRLQQFNRSGLLGKSAHSGGATFADKFKGEMEFNWLFVSVAGIDLKEPHASAFIRHVERALLWEFVRERGALPVCNRK